MRYKVQLLNVHPMNVQMAIECHELMTLFGHFLVFCQMCQPRIDCIVYPTNKKIVLSQWSKTCMSPNRKQIVRRQLVISCLGHKTIQQLLEMHVFFSFSLLFVSIHLCVSYSIYFLPYFAFGKVCVQFFFFQFSDVAKMVIIHKIT